MLGLGGCQSTRFTVRCRNGAAAGIARVGVAAAAAAAAAVAPHGTASAHESANCRRRAAIRGVRRIAGCPEAAAAYLMGFPHTKSYTYHFHQKQQ